jgi:hypothetical protein
MKNVVRKKNSSLLIIIIIILFIFISCKKSSKNSTFLLDVYGDAKLDTLSIEDNINKHYLQDINIYVDGKKERIISLMHLKDSSFVLTKPKIEMIYLEANNIQSDKKGLRVLIRNTDLIPDCFFIDILYKKEWIIKEYGIINTNSNDSLYIFNKEINKSLTEEFGSNHICNPKEIVQIYFNGKWNKNVR